MKLFDAQDFAGAVHQLDDAFPAANGVLRYAAIDNLTGWALFKQGLVDSALQSYRSSLNWALAAPDSDAIGAALSQIGIIYGGLTGRRPRTQLSNTSATRSASTTQSPTGGHTPTTATSFEAEFAYVTHQPDSALWYGKMRLLAMLAVGNDTLIAGALANIGNDYRDLNQCRQSARELPRSGGAFRRTTCSSMTPPRSIVKWDGGVHCRVQRTGDEPDRH